MKLKFDSRSLKARIGINFILFAAVLLLLLWITQVLFLNTFYQSMKENATDKIIRNLENAYNKSDTAGFLNTVTDLSSNNDVFIYINTPDGSPLISSSPEASYSRYALELQQVYETMIRENRDSVSILIKSQDETRKMLAYGKILSSKDKPVLIAYVISPLFPMDSTIQILKTQLLGATGISLILALILALYLSNRIATPIRSISTSAAKLAQGEYGITFKGGPYTELSELADTLTHTSLELEKSASLQKDLIANVSHDLKTPLTMVKSYAEMIRDLSGDNPEKREKHLQVIIEEADRLNVLVSDLLALSKMQSGAIVLNTREFNLYSEAETMSMYYKLLMEEEGYNITFTCPEDLSVKGDPDRLKQVFANLINNALKFCGEDRAVNITIQKKGRHAMCQIEDHGAGIPEDELPHIWERYYKASSNMVRSTTGSGLGLSIVKEILSLHKVNYGVNSTVGEGTTFWFELELV